MGEPTPGGMQASFRPLRQTQAPGSKLKAVFALEAVHRAAVAPGAAWPMTPSWPTAPMGAGQRPGRDTTLNKEADP